MELSRWLQELKRRRVFRALVGYGVVAFGVVQVTEPLVHALRLPEWVLSAVVLALGIGFPVAVVLAWTFDLRSSGIERTAPDAASAHAPASRSRLALLLVGLGLAAAAPGVAYFFLARPDAAPERPPSIAVLPFVDLSPQKDQEYFSDGVAEEILNALARVDGLRVVGRTSSFSFKGKNEDVRAIGRALDVGALLEGSVRRSGDRVRVTAQLVGAADGYRLWSDSYDRELSDVFAVQSDIARSVAAALRVELLNDARALPDAYRTPNPEAYDSYLLGRQLMQRGSHASLTEAVDTLRRAVSLDRGYAPAWAALAHAVLYRGWLEVDATAWAAARREARAAAENAVRLRPDLADGYVSRAAVGVYDWEWTAARADLDRAVSIDPRAVELQNVLVRSALAHGDTGGAIAAATRMTEDDPLNPRAWSVLGISQHAAGNADLARRAFARATGLNAEYLVGSLNVIFLDLMNGRPAEALAGCDRVRARADAESARIYTRFCLAAAAIAHHELGEVRESDAALGALLAEAPAPATFIADVYAWRGQRDEAFAWLERAVADHDQYGGSIATRRTLRKIRDDPRFAALLRQVGLQSE